MSHPLIIDVHSHPLFPLYTKALTGDTGLISGLPMPTWTPEGHIAVMDQHGIEVCVLSLPESEGITLGKKGHALARELNEELAALIQKYPKRFGAFAVVPLDDMDAAVEEMSYALDVLKLDGIATTTHFNDHFLGEPEYDPWFAEMNERSATLFIHPTEPANFNAKSKLNVSVVDFMFETTKMLTYLVLSGTKQKFSKINMISTHAGGAIPFLAHRVSLAGTMPWAFKGGPKMSTQEIMSVFGTFYFDLTASTAPTSLDAVSKLVSPDRLLMGFDYPMMPSQTIEPAWEAFQNYPGFDDAAREKISCGNAGRLLPHLAAG